MKNIFWFQLIVLSSFFSGWSLAEHSHIKAPVGEFYEYDIEGDHKEKVKRELSFHTKQVIKAPFKAVQWCYRTSRESLRKISKSIELFLSSSRSVDKRQEELRQAVSEWEHQMKAANYYGYDDKREHKRFLFGLPEDAWAALKSILYTAGFKFPRATLQTVKRFIHGTRHCVSG